MFDQLKDRVEKRAIASAIIVPTGFVVVAFLALACFFVFNEWLPPALAALVTAAIGIIVIAVVFLLMRIATRKPEPSPSAPPREWPDRLELVLQQNVDPVLSEWIRKNPDRAAIATLLLGVAAGYSDSFQKILLDMYKHYAETETRRRATSAGSD